MKHFMRGIFLVLLLSGCSKPSDVNTSFTYVEGGITRSSTREKSLALVFTGDQYADGAKHIQSVIDKYGIKGSFFFTGNFYRNDAYSDIILDLKAEGHYLGAHSDQHLLYCSWEQRDSLLVSEEVLKKDIEDNYKEMAQFGIQHEDALFYMPPYEWYNKQISTWTKELGLTLVNFTPGTRSNADYTTPEMGKRYVPSDQIFQSILAYEQQDPDGLNGFLLLIHIGTAPARTDKFYLHLENLISALSIRGYQFKRIDALINL